MSKDNNYFSYKDGVSLKEYFETQINALEKATSLAKENLEIRLEGLNEWRQQSKDREINFATKQEVTQLSRLVYIGVGIIMTIEFIFKFLLK